MSKKEIRRKRWNLIAAIIGLLTIGLLSNVIKKDGITDLAFTLEIFYLLSALLVMWLPEFAYRMIRSRISKDQFKNAQKVSKTMFIYALTAGIAGCLIMYILSVIMEKHTGFLGHFTYLAMRNFALCFILYALVQMFHGYYHGYLRKSGADMPKVICDILLKALGIAFILLPAKSEYAYGSKVGELLKNNELPGNYGAVGAARGYLLMYTLMLLFMILLFVLIKSKNLHNKEGMRLNEDGKDILFFAVKNEWANALSGFLLHTVSFAGLILFYQKSMGLLFSEEQPYREFSSYGIFFGNFCVLAGIETILILFALIPAGQELLQAYKKEEQRNLKQLSSISVLSLFLCGLFMGVVNLSLTGCMSVSFFGKAEHEVLTTLLRVGSFIPMFLAFGLFFFRFLKDTGREKTVLLCVAYSLAGFLVVLCVALKITDGSIISLTVGSLCFSVMLALLTGIMAGRFLQIKIEWVRMCMMPIVAAVITGGCLYGLTKVMASLSVGLLAFVISLIAGLLLYIFLLLILRCIRKKDMICFPMSKIITFIGNLMNLLS